MYQHVMDYLDNCEKKIKASTGTGDINDQVRHIFSPVLIAEINYARYKLLMPMGDPATAIERRGAVS